MISEPCDQVAVAVAATPSNQKKYYPIEHWISLLGAQRHRYTESAIRIGWERTL